MEKQVEQNKTRALYDALIKNSKTCRPIIASDITKNWRYIDFINPKNDLPCISLEWLFGARGFIAGRMLVFQASYSKGKTSLMTLFYGMGQKTSNAYCFHSETEGAPPPEDRIYALGCDPEELILIQAKSLERCMQDFDNIVAILRGGWTDDDGMNIGKKLRGLDEPLDPECLYPAMGGIDSLSALGMDAEVNEVVGDETKTSAVAGHARKVSNWLAKRCGSRWSTAQTFVMLAVHEKENIGGMPSFGESKGTFKGEKPIGFHSTWITRLNSGKWKNTTTGESNGIKIFLEVTKNKVSDANKKIELYLTKTDGFDLIQSDYDFLSKNKNSPIKVSRGGSSIVCKDLSSKSFKSEEELVRAFYDNTDLLMTTRENLRIRGFDFDFERNYKNQNKESAEEEDENLKDEIEEQEELSKEEDFEDTGSKKKLKIDIGSFVK